MLIFETILALLLGAALLSMLARAISAPYPVLLALGGAVLAFAPGLPSLDLPPDLILALFVAPVLLDAAHDMSFRDLKRNWRPVFSLVVVAVGLTTLAVAMVARWFLPDMPWGAAIALGALLAPPDAVSAIAVMRQAKPPHQIRSVLEGESLLNDATSLLIYRLAVGAVVTGELTFQEAAPQFLLVAFGSVVVGWSLGEARPRPDRPHRGCADVDRPAVHHHFRRLAARRAPGPVRSGDAGDVRAHDRAQFDVRHARRCPTAVLRQLGDRDFCAQCAGFHADRPAAAPDPARAGRRQAHRLAAAVPCDSRGRHRGSDGLGVHLPQPASRHRERARGHDPAREPESRDHCRLVRHAWPCDFSPRRWPCPSPFPIGPSFC